MTDIIERLAKEVEILNAFIPQTDTAILLKDSLVEIESLRQQVRELTELLDCVKSERDQQIAECQAECEEQARLNGQGGSREAALLARLAECQAREKVLRDALQQCAYDEEGFCINPDAAEALEQKAKELE
jgi:transposase